MSYTRVAKLAVGLILAVGVAACGSSPTAPDQTPAVAVPTDAAAGASLSGKAGIGPLVPPACSLEAIVLSVMPSPFRNSQIVEASYKGTDEGCPSPNWSASSGGQLSVDPTLPMQVVVSRAAASKLTIVYVTAHVETGAAEMWQTVPVYFPKLTR